MLYQKYLVLLCSLFVIVASPYSLAANKYPLIVRITPPDATVMIMNIPDKFYQGIKLKPGSYHIRVLKVGYRTQNHKITIGNAKKDITVRLMPDNTKRYKKYKLFVNATPKNAKIRITNIIPKYQHGMLLKAGKYDIKVSSSGCRTYWQSIQLQQDFTLPVKLACRTKISQPPIQIPVKTYTLPPIKNIEPGKYKLILSDGVKQQQFEITVQGTVLKIGVEKTICHLSTKANGIKEVSINGQNILQFVPVDTPDYPTKGGIDVALRASQAQQFYQEAQYQLPPNSSPLLPLIFRAASDNPVFQVIPQFWIQPAPINLALYKAIIPDGSIDSVSYDDATIVINQLNRWCQGTAQFKLPQEKHFVYLTRQFYNPADTKQLKSCRLLRKEEESDPNRPFKKLLGYQWQLTQSHCQPFDDSHAATTIQCDEQRYVKKGGSIESRDATECMPEYRAESLPDMREPNTTFRLLLIP